MIIAWPPVNLVSEPVWTVRQPISKSYSGFKPRRRYASAIGRPYIHAELSVSALSEGRGAGYMEALIRLLEGGEHYVRLSHKTRSFITGRPERLFWATEDEELFWTSEGDDLWWFTDTPGVGTPVLIDGVFPGLQVTGLPASTPIAVAGEHVSVNDERAMVLAPASTDASGTVILRVSAAFTETGPSIIGDTETGIFEVIKIPEAGGGGTSRDYVYNWEFDQIFEDELVGTHDEVNPWSAL